MMAKLLQPQDYKLARIGAHGFRRDRCQYRRCDEADQASLGIGIKDYGRDQRDRLKTDRLRSTPAWRAKKGLPVLLFPLKTGTSEQTSWELNCH
jgi:hypothetical protein